jgi:hypothetical protein
MKTLRLMMSALSILALTACGASDVNDEYEPTPEPESTPDATPVPTEIPNIRPDAPLFTLSATAVKPQEQVLIHLELNDVDGDVMTSVCAAALTSQVPEFGIDDSLTKVSETEWTFTAPITATEIGLAVIRCHVNDDRGGVSELAESMTIQIDNRVDVEPGDPGNNRDICLIPKLGCKIGFNADDVAINVSVPDPQVYVPDQVRGMFVDLPHTDFVLAADVLVNTDVARYSILDTNLPSIQVTVGTDATGLGYSLELIPYATSGSKFSTLQLQWRWQVRALAADGMTKENLFGGQVLASGNLGVAAPQHVEARVQDGLLQFAINGSVFTPAIAATNVAGSQVGFSARAAEVQFADAYAVLKP